MNKFEIAYVKRLRFVVVQDVTRGIDTSLTLKLQKRLTELEQEKQSLRNELENKEEQYQRARARVLTRATPFRLVSETQILHGHVLSPSG